MPIILDGTNGAFLPTWTTATRPASPANGEIGYNSTTAQLDQYVGSAWSSIPTGSASAATPTALGTVYGSMTTSGASPYLTALGYQSSNSNTGTENTSVGYRALYNNSSGTENVAIGSSALLTNTTASDSVAIGRYALYTNNASNNTAVGANTMYSNTSGINNTACGQSAGYSNTTGIRGTFIGQNAGSNLATGDAGIFIGWGCAASSTSVSNETVIGANLTGKGASTTFIGTGGAPAYQANNSSSWSTTSDFRLKKNIVDNTDGLDKIVQIRVRNFEYRTAEEVTELPVHTVIDKQGVQLGVIAQELREIYPDCVKEESTGVISVDSDNIFWHMINAIKDLKAIVDTQAAEIAELKAKVA